MVLTAHHGHGGGGDEPALERVLVLWEHWRHDVVWIPRLWSWRRSAKWSTTPRRTRRLGWRRGRRPSRPLTRPPGKTRPTQIPVLLRLLEAVGYPDVAGMKEDLTNSFEMIGEIRRGPGWRPRSDGRYTSPTTIESFPAATTGSASRRGPPLRRPASTLRRSWPSCLGDPMRIKLLAKRT